jgi:hypothetical protein
MYAQDGTPRGTLTKVLDPQRSWTWEEDFSPDENRSAYITSTQPIVASFDGFWAQGFSADATAWSTSYESIPASRAGNTLFYPNVYRVRNGFLETGSWMQWANLFVQNTSPSATANITATWYKTGETSATWQYTYTIPSNSAVEFNTRYGGTGGDPSQADFRDNLGAGFYGSVIIESDQPVVGVSHSFWDTNFKSGSTYAALTLDEGAYALYTPFVYKLGTCGSGSSWQAWSKVAVANIDDVDGEVYVYFLEDDGTANTISALQGVSIASGGADAFNTRYGADSGVTDCSGMQSAVGTSFQGSMLITSTAKIVGINNMIWPNRINTINTKKAP